MTTLHEIRQWWREGVRRGATHMLVVCDTFDHEDYPSYVSPDQDVNERIRYYQDASMQRIMEVYALHKAFDGQAVHNGRAWDTSKA